LRPLAGVSWGFAAILVVRLVEVFSGLTSWWSGPTTAAKVATVLRGRVRRRWPLIANVEAVQKPPTQGWSRHRGV